MNEQEVRQVLVRAGIDVTKPVHVTVPGVGTGYGCRICIATYGLVGEDVTGLPQTPEDFDEHFREQHG